MKRRLFVLYSENTKERVLAMPLPKSVEYAIDEFYPQPKKSLVAEVIPPGFENLSIEQQEKHINLGNKGMKINYMPRLPDGEKKQIQSRLSRYSPDSTVEE